VGTLPLIAKKSNQLTIFLQRSSASTLNLHQKHRRYSQIWARHLPELGTAPARVGHGTREDHHIWRTAKHISTQPRSPTGTL